MVNRDAKFLDGFGFAARAGEYAREKRAQFSVRRHFGKLAAEQLFGIGGAPGLDQPPDVVRRRIHAERVIEPGGREAGLRPSSRSLPGLEVPVPAVFLTLTVHRKFQATRRF